MILFDLSRADHNGRRRIFDVIFILNSLRTKAQRANNLVIDRDLTLDQFVILKKLNKMNFKNVNFELSESASFNIFIIMFALIVIITFIS